MCMERTWFARGREIEVRVKVWLSDGRTDDGEAIGRRYSTQTDENNEQEVVRIHPEVTELARHFELYQQLRNGSSR